MQPSISVVVIGRDEGSRLVRCLESVSKVRDGGLEVQLIYVDSGSVDGSPATAAAFGAEVIALNAQHPTAALGRNAGWRHAQAPFVLFLDGDTVLHPDFPEIAKKILLQDDSTAVVWGHRREIYPEHSLYNRILDLDWIYAPGETLFCGGDALVRRSALDAVQGYDGALIAGEEPELCRRLRASGFRIVHIDFPMTGHDLNMTRWSQYWKRAIRGGYAYAEISRRYRKTSDPAWSDESRQNLIRGTFWALSLAVALIASVRTFLPLAAWLAIFLLLALRSGWKARWKAPGRAGLLFAYGVHSQLAHIPVCVGQIKHSYDRKNGKQRGLIDYKE